jgi:hypothetical protein
MGKTGVATYTNDFVRAMVSYRQQVFDVHFVTPWSTAPLARAALHTINPDDPSLLVKPLKSLPSMLQRTSYIAVHVPGGPRVGVFANLVHRYARESTSVKATLHTARYPLIADLLRDALPALAVLNEHLDLLALGAVSGTEDVCSVLTALDSAQPMGEVGRR